MNDEKMDKYLKAALTTNVTDDDIRVDYSLARKKHIVNYKKIVAAFSAALILVATALYVPKLNNRQQGDKGAEFSQTNVFTITAYASEIDSEHYCSVGNEKGYPWSISEVDDLITFNFTPDIKVTGEEIDHISYQVENGVFQIVGIKGDYTLDQINVINDGVERLHELYGTMDSKVYEGDTSSIEEEVLFASEYSVDYEEQEQKSLQLNLCGHKKISETNKYLSEADTIHEAEKTYNAINDLMGDIRVKCTVYYTDGSMECKTIAIGAVMRDGEYGDGKPYQYACPGFTLVE